MFTNVLPFLALTVVSAQRAPLNDERLPLSSYKEDPPTWQELEEDAPSLQELEKPGMARFHLAQWALSTPAVQIDDTAMGQVTALLSFKMLIISCMIVVCTVLYAVCGLGDSILFHGLYMLCTMAGIFGGDVEHGNVLEPVLYISMTTPAIQMMQVYNLWVAQGANTRGQNKPFTLTFAASMLLGLLPGMWLLTSVQAHSTSLQVVLALAMATTLVAKLSESGEPMAKVAGQTRTGADLTILGVLLTVVLCGVGSGFSQGSVGVGGAPKMIMILALEISNEEWRSTACVADAPLHIIRFILLVMTGHIDIVARWAEICVLYVGVFVGLYLGNMLAPFVSGRTSTRVVMTLMCLTMFQLCAHFLWKITAPQLYLLMASSSLLVCAAFFCLLVGLGVAVRGKFGTLFVSARCYCTWDNTEASPNMVRGISSPLSVIFGATTYWIRPAPNVWIIGEKMAGTESLHYYLSHHPNIIAKETHFFSGRSVFGPELSAEVHLQQSFYPSKLYHFIKKLFSPLGFRQPVIAIEATPWNMMLPWAIDGIQKLSQGRTPPRVVAILREPIDRAEADYWSEFARQNEAATFEGALQAEKTKDAWFWEDSWCQCVAEASLQRMWADRPDAGANPFETMNFRQPPRFAYERRGHYIEHLRPWLRCFSSDNILLLSHDELVKDPLGTTNMVINWLGLVPCLSMDVSAMDVGSIHKEAMDPKIRRTLEERYIPTLSALVQEADFPVASKWLNSYGHKQKETKTVPTSSTRKFSETSD